jgi:hypothetical protein
MWRADFASFRQDEWVFAAVLGSFWVRFSMLFLCFQVLLSFVPTIFHFSISRLSPLGGIFPPCLAPRGTPALAYDNMSTK